MAKQNEHGRLIAEAAKGALVSLGCKRKGQSRLWIADQRFWLILIEFQPSGWSKGSYLNVGAMWLWHAKDHWSFDHGHRIEDFVPLHDSSQFAAAAADLAARAAKEIGRLRRDFHGLEAIARCLVANSHKTMWERYHAAVASGLVGHMETSRQLFHQVERWPATRDWEKELQVDSAGLAAHLGNQQGFRSAVLAVIQRARALHKLPLDPTCLDETGATPMIRPKGLGQKNSPPRP